MTPTPAMEAAALRPPNSPDQPGRFLSRALGAYARDRRLNRLGPRDFQPCPGTTVTAPRAEGGREPAKACERAGRTRCDAHPNRAPPWSRNPRSTPDPHGRRPARRSTQAEREAEGRVNRVARGVRSTA